jgi:hypothetical protein
MKKKMRMRMFDRYRDWVEKSSSQSWHVEEDRKDL